MSLHSHPRRFFSGSSFRRSTARYVYDAAVIVCNQLINRLHSDTRQPASAHAATQAQTLRSGRHCAKLGRRQSAFIDGGFMQIKQTIIAMTLVAALAACSDNAQQAAADAAAKAKAAAEATKAAAQQTVQQAQDAAGQAKQAAEQAKSGDMSGAAQTAQQAAQTGQAAAGTAQQTADTAKEGAADVKEAAEKAADAAKKDANGH
ncbi:MAG TPA: hypothetical protein VGH81_11675 [Rudaea sp.]